MKKRKIDIAVLSDVHLGTFDCHAEELLIYLNSIQPKKLILNGDILDMGRHSKHYFPPSHMKVLRKIVGMASKGTVVHYIIGDHDEALRKFNNTSMGDLHIQDKLVLDLDGKKAWFFHGNVFDGTIYHTKWLAKLGGPGYSLLKLLNRIKNWSASKLRRKKYSLSSKIKNGFKNAVSLVSDFKMTAAHLAIKNGYQYVVCGHIHQPKKEVMVTKKGRCTYLNSGDWVENLTALEYSFKRWKIYRYNHDKLSPFFADEEIKQMDMHELIASIMATKEREAKKKTENL